MNTDFLNRRSPRARRDESLVSCSLVRQDKSELSIHLKGNELVN